MKLILAASALAIATPAAAQGSAEPAGHSQHSGHGQQAPAQHGQAQHGQPGQAGHGRHQDGERHDCPCCTPGADGRRPACCENMHRQHGTEGHQDHDRN